MNSLELPISSRVGRSVASAGDPDGSMRFEIDAITAGILALQQIHQRVRRFAAVEALARRKLRQLEIAGRLDDLKVPPGNHLEALQGSREGQMSIRIDDQWRVGFRWTPAGPADVEIIDYQ